MATLTFLRLPITERYDLLDGNAQNYVGSNNGTEYGNPCYTNGIFGKSVNFDGVDDYIELPIDGPTVKG